MISDSAALVLFAIRSSIKLGIELRQAFVDSTKRQELVLPLPNFFSTPDIVSAANYFGTSPGSAYPKRSPRLKELLTKRQTAGQTLTPAEEGEVQVFYVEFFNLDLANAGKLGTSKTGTTITGESFNAWITIRQWQRGTDPNPSTLQRVAGTLLEIGVDYFAHVPGALNQDSNAGKAIAGFLDALSEIRFSEESLGRLPARLFMATLETVSSHSDLLSADPKVQELVKVTTTTLAKDVANRLQQLGDQDLVKAEHIGDWAELVFRSVLTSAGGMVLADPQRYLGVEQPGQVALITNVGQSVLGLVLGDSGVSLDRLFSRQGLETVIKTSLAVLGEHPEILIQSKNAGLQKLLGAIATQLSQYNTPLTPDLLPELARMILEKTAENLPLLWPDLANKPEQHLLLTAAGVTLEILTRKPADQQPWKPQFSSADLLTVVQAVLSEVAANPTWLLNAAGQVNENLKLALESALGALRNHADERLSTGTAVEVLCAVVRAVGQRKEFLDIIPGGAAGGTAPLVSAALDLVFKAIFKPNLDLRASWQILRQQTILELVNLSLGQLAKAELRPDVVAAFGEVVSKEVEALAAGKAWDTVAFASQLQQALSA